MSLVKLTDCLLGKVTAGAIIGLDGGIWATTPGFFGDSHEMLAIATACASNSNAFYKGLTFLNELYVLTAIRDDTIVAERSGKHVILAQCPRCIVLGFQNEFTSFAKCSEAVRHLAELLRSPEFESQL
jgi:profilin